MSAPATRCAVHPARPAVDACPRCTRARCGPDADHFGTLGCGVCEAERAAQRPPPGIVELSVRSGLAAYLVALVGGWIGTQYVDVHLFAVVVPGLVGLACGWAATFALGGVTDPPSRRRALAIGVLGAVVSAGLAFRVESGGGQDPLASWGESGPPYLAAVIGTLAWPALFGTTPKPRQPKSRQPKSRQRGRGTS